jgi:HSP20 family protein
VQLPAGATEADVTATYRDGVLEIRVPVGEHAKAQPRRIPVTRS